MTVTNDYASLAVSQEKQTTRKVELKVILSG